MERFVSWSSLDLRISGARVAEVARQALAARKAPIEDLALDFRAGELLISARVVKLIPIPFQLAVRKIVVGPNSVTVPFEQASAFGFLPLPKILLSLVGNRQVVDGITIHPESLSVSVLLDRFLPPFVELTVERIDIVDGGLRVRCGGGGADLPSGGLKI